MGLWFIYICVALMFVCENVGKTAKKSTDK